MRTNLYSIRIFRLLCCLVLPAALLASCTSTPTGSGGDPLYIGGTFNGVALQLTDGGRPTGVVPTYVVDGKFTKNDSAYIALNFQRFSYYDIVASQLVEIATKPYLQITFSKRFTAKPIKSDLDPMVTLGAMPYGDEANEVDGVEIAYRDSSGTVWKSTDSLANQSGSTFVVTSHDHLVYFPGQEAVGHYITKGTFACNLYDGRGNSIKVADGKFVIRTIHYVPF